jgi:3-phenylpropionate/trans-cinnamate dioxygenase ferredoxin reductase subunit
VGFFDVLIVGAGHGGAQTALALRQRRFSGRIGVVTDEACLPYERPPLSKDFLAGKREFDGILIRAAAVWQKQNIELMTASRAIAIDPEGKQLVLADGRRLAYGNLVWSAGGRARRLTCSGSDLAGVHTIRNRSDVERLRRALSGIHSIVIVGAGYIGLETAATLSQLGRKVTILEAQARVLARVAGPELSEFYRRIHSERGVQIETSAMVAELEGAAGEVRCVRLTDGRRYPADAVIVGIGIEPNVEVPSDAGARIDNGVVVNQQCQSSLPSVFAIGDCAYHPNRYSQTGWARIESVPNATDQALTIAKTLTGEVANHDALPWFWSDQFGFKLQTAGLSAGFDQTVLRGDPDRDSFSVIYLREGRVIALDCVNSVKDFVQGRALVAARTAASANQLESPEVDLRMLVA